MTVSGAPADLNRDNAMLSGLPRLRDFPLLPLPLVPPYSHSMVAGGLELMS